MDELALMMLISRLIYQSPHHPNTFCKLVTFVRLS